MNPDHQFTHLYQTSHRVLQRLVQRWTELPAGGQEQAQKAVQALRAGLWSAKTPFERATLTLNFLYAVEAVPSALPLIGDILDGVRTPRRRSMEQLNSAEAQSLLEASSALRSQDEAIPKTPLDMPRVEPPPAAVVPALAVAEEPELAWGETSATAAGSWEASADGEPNAALAEWVLGTVVGLGHGWEQLSLDAQFAIRRALDDLEWELEQAANDGERCQAMEGFMARVQASAEAVAFEPPQHRSLRPTGGGRVSSDAADQVLQALRGHPGHGSSAEIAFEMAEPPETGVPKGVESAPAEDDQAAAVSFHTKVDFPGQVSIFEQRVPLKVQLTLEAPVVTVVDAQVKVEFKEPEQPELLTVLVNAEGFEEDTGDNTRSMLVYAKQDSQPVVFLLNPTSSGTKRIVLDFYHRGRLAGTAAFETEVRDRPPMNAQAPITFSQTLAIGGLPLSPPDPVDLELRIASGADKRTFTFMLHSPKGAVGYHWKTAGSITLAEEPYFFLERTFQRLSRMARSGRDRRTPEDDAAYRLALDEIGQNLYRDLFSPELKQQYRRIRQLREEKLVNNLLITSDEPWIPWELIKPFEFNADSGETEVDDDFLCASFRVSRWLAGRGVPDAVRVQTAQLVAPEADLAFVQQEKSYFEQLPQHRPAFTVLPTIASATGVIDALKTGTTQLYHFACHGNFDSEDPNESFLELQGERFAPTQIIGAPQAGVARSKPLIFLNACHSGQIGFALTGLGGWAERFVNAGASAFIGSLWEVNDELAAQFAIHFYDRLWDGATLGEAFHAARVHIRDIDDANPTWLAYTLYADPNGKAETGQQG